MPEAPKTREDEGWERRFVAFGERAEEAIQLYRDLGFEVVADPVQPDDMAAECTDCQLVTLFRTIYTRRR